MHSKSKSERKCQYTWVKKGREKESVAAETTERREEDDQQSERIPTDT